MSKPTFEIGLVGAGAISAGAYTAGVIDFMVQALDAWYAESFDDSDENTPSSARPHNVKISTFSGASAGGITAVLAAGFFGSDQPSIKSEEDASKFEGRNKLFDSWVEQIDISGLLASHDLRDERTEVVSLLDSSVLTDIADAGLDVIPRTTRRPYLAENFELIVTVTNLRGVPYAIDLMGSHPERYAMSQHGDFMQFRISDEVTNTPTDRYGVAWRDFGTANPEMKRLLKSSALASGAFPFGLAPHILSHMIPADSRENWYSARTWPIPTPDSVNPHACVTDACVPADFGTLAAEYHYMFEAVDGGVINNEPFELAHKVLAGTRGCNPRDGNLADRALLLIDPFPNVSTFDAGYRPVTSIARSALSLFNALINQARFKPDQLALAAKEDVFSRFMIAPSRDGAKHPIACGLLGGFGGFLKRDFRAHDYFLGRRNAQKFFKDHFALPETNSLFANWSPTMKDEHCVRNDKGQPVRSPDGHLFLPIIPLVGAATAPCDALPWPTYSLGELDVLKNRLNSRIALVLNRLLDQYFKTNIFLIQWVAMFVLWWKRRDLVEALAKVVETELRKFKLMK